MCEGSGGGGGVGVRVGRGDGISECILKMIIFIDSPHPPGGGVGLFFKDLPIVHVHIMNDSE